MHVLEQMEKFKAEGPYEGQEIFLRNRKLINFGGCKGITIPKEEIDANRLEEQELFDVLLIRTRKFGKKKNVLKEKTWLSRVVEDNGRRTSNK